MAEAGANAIPTRWLEVIEQATAIASDYDGYSAEVGEALHAAGERPSTSVPPNPLTSTLNELARTATIPAPLPHHSSGVLGTRGMLPGTAAFVDDDEAHVEVITSS